MAKPKKYSNHKNIVTLYPGEYRVSQPGEEVLLHTLLGSCVAACLYDPVADVVGMNHFLLSNRRYARNMHFTETEAGRYGIHSMELLINKMIKNGAAKSRIHAKAFGGCSNFSNNDSDNFHCVGDVNSKFIRDFLNEEDVPLIASDLGGYQGRVIYFSSQSFAVSVRKIARKNLDAVTSKEYRYWKKSVKEKTSAPGVDLELWE